MVIVKLLVYAFLRYICSLLHSVKFMFLVRDNDTEYKIAWWCNYFIHIVICVYIYLDIVSFLSSYMLEDRVKYN